MQLVVRAHFHTVATNKFICTGILDDSHLGGAAFFPALARLWLSNIGGLELKSITCTRCGPASFSCFFCPDPNCYYGLCYRCYSHSKYGAAGGIQWADSSDYNIPLPDGLTCSTCTSHGPLPGHPDLSVVQRPFILVDFRGLTGADEVRAQAAATRMHSQDNSFAPGVGCYPFVLDHRRIGKVSGGRRCREIAAAISEIAGSTLIITVGAHGVEGRGYAMGKETYTALQFLNGIILPLVRAFRGSAGRAADASVVVLFNCCDVLLPLWTVLMQTLPPGDAFTLISFRHPLLLADIPGVLATFTRAFTNDVLRRRGYTPAHCLASAMTWQFECSAQPMMIQSGGAPPIVSFLGPFSDFLFRPPALSPGALPSPLFLGGAVASPVSPSPPPAVGAPPPAALSPELVAAAHSLPAPISSTLRNSLVVDYIRSLTPAERIEQGVDMADNRRELVAALNKIVALIADGAPCPPYDSAKEGPFNKRFKKQYWRHIEYINDDDHESYYEWNDRPESPSELE